MDEIERDEITSKLFETSIKPQQHSQPPSPNSTKTENMVVRVDGPSTFNPAPVRLPLVARSRLFHAAQFLIKPRHRSTSAAEKFIEQVMLFIYFIQKNSHHQSSTPSTFVSTSVLPVCSHANRPTFSSSCL
jgi:hypothetical protein